MDDSPEQARTALTAIKTGQPGGAGRGALGAGRCCGTARTAHRGRRRPAWTALDDLVERTAAAGLPVTVEVTGTPGRCRPRSERAAYRIVQEALTNVTPARRPAGDRDTSGSAYARRRS